MSRTKKVYPCGQARGGGLTTRRTKLGKSYSRTTLGHPEAKQRALALERQKKQLASVYGAFTKR